MAGTYSNILFHVIFSTKHREPLITPDIQPRLYEYLGGIIRGENGVTYEIGGTTDHIHILFRWRTDVAVSTLMRDLKSHSSGWVHDNFPQHRNFFWQDGYGAFSVSQSQCETVTRYIAGQAEHHRVRTFQEEFVEFLRAHAIEYDPNLIWE